jgi:toxin ParE1/3/4
MRVRLAPQARSDLDAIWLYIVRESGSEESATHAIESITEKFALFIRFPFIGKTLGLERHPDIRTFAVPPHLIFYRPMSGEIRILRVIHGSRDALAVFAEE